MTEDTGSTDVGRDRPTPKRVTCAVKRRKLLGAVGAGTTFSFAGCLGLFELPEEESPEEGVFTNGRDDEEDAPDEDEEDDEATEQFDVEYTQQGETIEVPADQNLLVAGEEQGWDLPYLCRDGWCGECLARLDGDASERSEMTVNDYGPLDDDAITDGYVLTCTGFPRDDFAIETGTYGELDG